MAKKSKSKKTNEIQKSVMVAILVLGVIAFGVTLYIYLTNRSKNPNCCGDSDSSSFIPIATGVWVPIMVVFANRDREKMGDKQKVILSVITGIIIIALLIGIVAILVYGL